jgi:hypothetical protein
LESLSANSSEYSASRCPISEDRAKSIKEKIDVWLKEHEQTSYIKSKRIAQDLDIYVGQIGICLHRMEKIEKWEGESNVFLNPYPDIGDLE